MKILKSFEVAAPLERVVAAICSEVYHLESEKERPEVVSSTFVSTTRGEDGERFEVRSVEYKRTKLGGIDRGGTTTAVTRYTFSKRERTLAWEYGGGGAPARVKLSGVYRLEERGPEGPTRVNYEMEIVVNIPLIGNQIAKLVAREFESTWPRYERLMAKHAGQPAG